MSDTFLDNCPDRWRQVALRGRDAWAKTNTPCETWRDVPVLIRVQLMPIPGQTTERPPLVCRTTLDQPRETDASALVLPWGAGIRTIAHSSIEHVTVTPIVPEEKKEASDGH